MTAFIVFYVSLVVLAWGVLPLANRLLARRLRQLVGEALERWERTGDAEWVLAPPVVSAAEGVRKQQNREAHLTLARYHLARQNASAQEDWEDLIEASSQAIRAFLISRQPSSDLAWLVRLREFITWYKHDPDAAKAAAYAEIEGMDDAATLDVLHSDLVSLVDVRIPEAALSDVVDLVVLTRRRLHQSGGEPSASPSSDGLPAQRVAIRAKWQAALAGALANASSGEADLPLLGEARRTAEAAAALLARFSGGEQPKAVLDSLIGQIASKQYELNGEVEALRQGLIHLERAIDGPLSEKELFDLRYLLVRGYESLQNATNNVAWADRSVSVIRALLDAYPTRPEVADWKFSLAALLLALFNDAPSSSEDMLWEAALLLHEVPVEAEELDREFGVRLSVLVFCYALDPEPGRREEIERWVRRALDQSDQGRPESLRYLVGIFHNAYLLREEALLTVLYSPLLRPVLATLDPLDPQHRQTIKLTSALATTTLAQEGTDLLRECIDLLRPLAEGEQPDTDIVLALASALGELYLATDDLAAIAEAKRRLQRMLHTQTTPGSLPPHRYAYLLMHSGSVLYGCAQAESDLQTLAEAADLLRKAAETAPSDWRFTANLLNYRGQILCSLFESTGDRAVLDESIAFLRQGVRTAQDHSPHITPSVLASLGYALDTAYRHDPDTNLLAEALTVGRAAAEAAPDSARAHNNFGSILRLSYSRTRNLTDLDASIAHMKRAVDLTPDSHADRTFYVSNLVSGLLARYDHSGEGFVLDEARTRMDGVIRTVRQTGQHAPSALMTFCHLQYALFMRYRDAGLLGLGISAARRAVADIPDGDVRRVQACNSLAVLLTFQYSLEGDLDLLEEVETLLGAALDDGPVASPHLSIAWLSRSQTQLLVFQRTGRLEALLNAEHGLRRAATLGTGLREASVSVDLQLASILLQIHEKTGRQGALAEARRLYAGIADDDGAGVDSRFVSAWGLAQITAFEADPHQAVRVYGAAANLLTELAPLTMSWNDRRMRLQHLSGFGADAAQAALAAGDPRRAVELLEQTRGVLLSDARELHDDLARLDGLLPDAAAEYRRLRERMRLLDTEESLATPFSPPPPLVETERIRAEREELEGGWKRLLDSVRAHPEFRSFLRPLPFDRILGLVDDVPVVMVLAGDTGGHALIVSKEDVHALPLPGLTDNALAREVRTIRGMIADAGSPEHREAAANRLLVSLAWTWDTVTGPVLDALGLRETTPAQDPPRIRWCAVGNVAYLPLHAARRSGARRHSALDRVVSTYTPTIRALGQALSQAPSHDAATLLVAQPDTPGATPLLGVARETDGIARLVPGALLLSGPDATRAAVLTAIGRRSIAHFACHGIGDDLSGPPRLLLHDHQTEPLTVESLTKLRLHADLAFLSACSSTGPFHSQLDEALHITSGFLTAGYRQVIGTLWPVADIPAARLAIGFYSVLTGDGTGPPDPSQAPFALRKAALRAREEDPGNPFTWAAYLHVGA
ncbi:CHAT domain-containing protein [Actinocorallia sp. B10E7]|uniref:CHAT domain-containing protein n=1 Tax=Actinocorallia sp. B10E7 TaxID=3153558 RepID=UPI00325C5927